LKSNPRLDSENGLKVAIVSFLVALAGGGLSFAWETLGWVIAVAGAAGAMVGIAIHWWLNWHQITHRND
jgi:uncharacterized membrane protein